MKTKALIISMMAALCVWSCSNSDDEPAPKQEVSPVESQQEVKKVEEPIEPTTRHSYKPIDLYGPQKKMNASLQEFSWKLFKEVFTHRDGDINLMISPISLEYDLGMFVNGLSGETQQELLKTLGMEGYTMDEINNFFKTMLTGLETADEAATFKSANSFWYRQGLKANDNFLSAIQNFYDAQAEAVDFTDPQTVEKINAWCADKTNNRIDKILDATSEEDVFHLLNAVYFKATWLDPFDKEETTEQPFHYANGKTEKVDMMHQLSDALYLENDKYQLAMKPFVDGAFQMVFILPKEGVDAVDAIPGFLANAFNIVRDDLAYQFPETHHLDLYAPKFSSDYTEGHLIDYMKNINPAFNLDNKADFMLFDGKKDYIIDAVQKTFFLMDEVGAEAAAVTDIAGYNSVPPPATMRLDRPFFYAIVESKTYCPLFIGYYGN